MPRFETDAEVDVEVQEFLEACNSREIIEVIRYLEKEGEIDNTNKGVDKISIIENEFRENLDAIRNNYLNLTKEEELIVGTIAKRFLYR